MKTETWVGRTVMSSFFTSTWNSASLKRTRTAKTVSVPTFAGPAKVGTEPVLARCLAPGLEKSGLGTQDL